MTGMILQAFEEQDNDGQREKIDADAKWEPPLPGWWKLITGRASKQGEHQARAKTVIRNDQGTFTWGWEQPLGEATAIEAEAVQLGQPWAT